MNITQKHRTRTGSKRIDLSSLRELTQDSRYWVGVALVVVEGESHYDLDGEDLIVHVEIQPLGTPVSCRMLAVAGGPNAGIWSVPPVGAEVLIALPNGELGGGGVLIGCLSTGNTPTNTAQNVIVIAAGSKVLIHDGNGGAVPLATKADVQTVVDTYNDHIHLGGDGSPTSKATVTANLIPNPGTPPPLYIGSVDVGAADPDGTTILEAK